MNKKELANEIGTSFLDSIEKMREEKKDFGRFVVVPIRPPLRGDDPPWISSIQVNMPIFTRVYYDQNGEAKFESISMAEYYGWKK